LSVLAGVATSWAWFGLVARPGEVGGADAAMWLASWIWFPAYFLLPTALLLLAPDGRLPSRRWRPVLWLTFTALLLLTVVMAVSPYPTGGDVVIPQQPPGLQNPVDTPALHDALGWSIALLPAAVLSALAAVVTRWRRAAGLERQQLKVVAVGAVATVLLVAAGFLTPAPWYLVVVATALVPYPLALAVAALRYRLWDVDVVIRRSVVYGVVSVAVVAAYVVVIVTLGGLLGRTTGAPLLATAIVAAGVAPLRSPVQRAADRWLFGDAGDPAAAVTRLSRRWQARDSRVSLADLSHDVATSLRLPYARITAADGTEGSWGRPVEPVSRVPLLHDGAVVGELVAGTREAGRPLGRRDSAALSEIGGYLAVSVQALRLAADLQRSRERIVVAREEERRRLRRDLHDGLGPQLAAIALQLESVRDLAGDGPASDLAESLRRQLRSTVGDVRHIVDDLRPAALDDLGLAEALQQLVERMTTPSTVVTLDLGDPLMQLSAAAEVAVLRIVGEAVTNAVRHARASHCSVSLRCVDGLLDLEVADDGIGLPVVPAQRGVGLASMRERAAELGGTCTTEPGLAGGTTVRVLLPVETADR
jgi:signal transduction histidine kinase